MTEECSIEVLICGAGAAGLTLAIDLARRGVRFRLIEKSPEPFRGSRGKGIQPRTQEILEDLGILDRIVALGGIYPPLRKYRDDGSYVEPDIAEGAVATPAEPYCVPLMVAQFLTEQVMRDRLAELGRWVEFGCELVGFEQDDEGVEARLSTERGEERIRARYLIGADGGRSFVRQSLRIDFPGKTLGVRAMVADVALRGLTRDAWHQFSGRSSDELVMISPLMGTSLFQVQAPVPLEGEVDLSAEGIARMIAQRTGRNDIRIEAVSWASAYNMNARLAGRFREGRVFLVGDAAHIHPPTGGQGLNTSLQDAYNLGWKLAAVIGGASDALLDSYELERRPVAANVLGLSTSLLKEAQRGELRRGREVRQLDIGYSDSPLTLAVPAHARAVRAGDRAPDAPLRGAAGQAKRLFELFAGPHWTLLGYEVDRKLVGPRASLRIHTIGSELELRDDAGYFRDAYGLQRGDWILVRPDGYIGAIVSSQELPQLDDYLRTNIGERSQ
jgi:2-polyprenyl-6-methoxyphenol hydroxylase-like FAD-dependent oxidoreductase